jgi:hypothetical protein
MLNRQLKSTVLLIAYNRPDLFSQLLNSFENSIDSNSQFVVIVHQVGNSQVQDLISQFSSKHKLVHVIPTTGDNATAMANISFNRLTGYDYCFDSLKSDYVIAFEDDVVMSTDILKFSEYIMFKHWDEKDFKGINFGSYVKFNEATSKEYSKVRHGIHGPASAIHKNTWIQFNKSIARSRANSTHWDGAIEYMLKTGFMVCPINSRYMDYGHGGTHAPALSSDMYFVKLNDSYTNNYLRNNFVYTLTKNSIPWMVDMPIYCSRENWKYRLLYFFNSRNNLYIFYKIERLIYKLFILKKKSRA